MMKCRNNVVIIHCIRIEVKCIHKEYCVQMQCFVYVLSILKSKVGLAPARRAHAPLFDFFLGGGLFLKILTA